MSYQPYQVRLQIRSLKKQQGVVIVVALFIIAIVASLSYVMMARLERDIDRTNMLLHNQQAENYAQGSIAWAIDTLQTNAREQRPYKQIDLLPATSPESTMNGYKIKSTIYDAQARFNLNSISNKEQAEFFKRLITYFEPEMSQNDIADLTVALADWINPQANEELEKYYAKLPKPYRPAHMLMQHASELRLVKGMTAKLYNMLQPYIVALPLADAKMNVQTMPVELIANLSTTMDLKTAQAVIAFRQEGLFNTVEDFTELAIIKEKGINPDILQANSSYFTVETTVKYQQQHLVLYTLLERTQDGKVIIMWQSKGIN